MTVSEFGVVLGVLSNLVVTLLRKRESWLLYFDCAVAVCVLCLFLRVPLVGLQSVIFLIKVMNFIYISFSYSMTL